MSQGRARLVVVVVERGPHRGRRAPARITDPHPALFDPLPVGTRPSDERHTPRWLFDALGLVFDLDVAAPAGGPRHVPCRAYYTALDDGLAQPWHGLVWCNPPFSRVAAWAERCIDHGHGLLLAPMSTNTRWVSDAIGAADTLVPLPQIKFEAGDHTAQHVSFGILLYAFGELAATACAELGVPAFVRANP